MIAKLIRDFRAQSAEEARAAARLSQFAASFGNAALGREIVGEVGHVTGAAWILNRDATRVLLVFGSKEAAWKIPGAHCETQNETPRAFGCLQTAQLVASRALGRDAGQAHAPLFAVYEQEVPAYWNTPAHLHFELVFRFDQGEETLVLPRGARWFELSQAAQLGSETIARLVRKTHGL